VPPHRWAHSAAHSWRYATFHAPPSSHSSSLSNGRTVPCRWHNNGRGPTQRRAATTTTFLAVGFRAWLSGTGMWPVHDRVDDVLTIDSSQSWSDPSLTASIHNAAFGNMLLFSDTAASFPGRSAHISIHCASPRVKAIGYSYASLSASWTEGWASELVRGKVATAWVAAVAGEAKVRLRIEVQARDRWPAR
jgi:hypothetical protein